METSTKVLSYVIEHFEGELSDWTLSEYIHMLLVLGGLYCEPTIQPQSMLIITNFPFVNALNNGSLKEDELGTLKNTQRFVKIISKQNDAF